MILSFKRDMTHNYMVTESEEILSSNDYQIHMLTENRIGGLLPCSIKKVNGKGRYFFDITSRQSMANIYEKEYIGADDIRILLKGLYEALAETKKYLLDADKVVLEPEMIYMDVETKEALFCYLPVYKGTIHASFGKLCEYIMRRLDQNDREAVLLGYEVYRQSLEENYSLEKILKKAAFEKQAVFRKEDKETWNGQTDRESCDANRTQELDSIREDSAKDAHQTMNAGRAQGSRQTVWDKEPINRGEPVRDDDMKSVPGDAGGSERKKNVRPEEAGTSGRRERKRKKGKKGENGRRKREEKRNAPKKDRTHGAVKTTGMIVLFLILALAVGAAAWMWELDMTQLGGLIFLLVCLIGYGFSASAKQKRKKKDVQLRQEEKADRQSVKKMQEMKKNMHDMEKAAAIQQKDHMDWQGGRQQLQKTTEEWRDETKGTKEIKAAPPMIGATVLLSAGEEEYEPHLSLISMNPRERNSVVLLNDSYTIGKLKNKSDIYIDDPSISRMHARICKEGRDYWLCDLNSTNGTFVNGRRLSVNESVPIKLSDEIRFAELGYYVGRC